MAVKWPWSRKRIRLAWNELPVAWPAPVAPASAGSMIVAPVDVDVLARYNAERARGIVHTEEWRAKMAELQRQRDGAYGPTVDGDGLPRSL